MVRMFTWYTSTVLMSFNAVFNFIVGGRGIGKTWHFKYMCVRKSMKSGEQFIYLRRYKEEIKTSKPTFFNDIGHKFPNHDFRIFGNEAQYSHVKYREDKKREWHTIGYFMALSTAQNIKGVALPLVTRIIFDEFIIEKGSMRYLTDEVKAFINFFSTVDRYQDKTRVFFLANSVSIMNPYFLEYDIKPEEVNEYVTRENGFIAAHFPDSEKFKNEIYQTRFGKFIKNTEYADYAVGNQFKDNHDGLIRLKDSTANYLMTLETPRGTFSVWQDMKNSEFYAQKKRPKVERCFTLIAENVDEDTLYLTFSDNVLGMLRGTWRRGRMFFDDPSTRNAFAEVFKR